MRLGKIYINSALVEHEEAKRIFRVLDFVPTRAEMLFYRDAIEYVGTSPSFEECEEGCLAPEYNITIDGDFIEVEKVY